LRYGLPSSFEEIPHTADVGLKVHGRDLAEVYARAALGMAQLQAGGGTLEPGVERSIVAQGEDPASLLVDLCRQVLRAFFLEKLLLAAIEPERIADCRIEARGWFDTFDPRRHIEGMDIKAVTYARAAVVPVKEGGLVATVVFDI
jgi:SHS2 domain-containing protein